MLFTNKKNVKWMFFKLFSNLNFAIGILFFILLFSILGSIIEQHQSLAYYQKSYPVNTGMSIDLNWKIIINLGLDHIYESWWFLLILLTLSLSLITCTFSVQLPSLRNARRWKFMNNSKALHQNILFTEDNYIHQSIINIAFCLNKKGYYCFNRQYALYAYRGLVGRIAPIIVHISLIIILLGSTISFTNGFIVQEMVPVGEVFHVKNILGAGFNNIAPIYDTFRINKFYINYNFDNSIKQFFSQLSYIDINAQTKIYPTIFVNSPLRFKGITFYQTDWQINALRIQIDSSCIVQYKLNKVQIGKSIFWICYLPIEKNNYLFMIVSSLNDDVYIYNNLGQLISVTPLNQKVHINSAYFIIKEIMSSTGLQIKVDPGLSFVYLGFALLMASTFISYISYSQLWFSINGNSCYLNGSTNRAILSFEEEIANLSNKYIQNSM